MKIKTGAWFLEWGSGVLDLDLKNRVALKAQGLTKIGQCVSRSVCTDLEFPLLLRREQLASQPGVGWSFLMVVRDSR